MGFIYDDTMPVSQSIYGLVCYVSFLEKGAILISDILFSQQDNLNFHIFDYCHKKLQNILSFMAIIAPIESLWRFSNVLHRLDHFKICFTFCPVAALMSYRIFCYWFLYDIKYSLSLYTSGSVRNIYLAYKHSFSYHRYFWLLTYSFISSF